VKAGRELLAEHLDDLPLLRDVIADRGYRGLAKLAARKHLGLHIKAPPNGSTGFVPLAPLYKGRARVRAPGPLAAAVALLRGDRGERARMARSGLRRLPVRTPPRGADVIRCTSSLRRGGVNGLTQPTSGWVAPAGD
jgi:hypothetical protein